MPQFLFRHKALLAGGLIQTNGNTLTPTSPLFGHKALLAGGLIQTQYSGPRRPGRDVVTKPF